MGMHANYSKPHSAKSWYMRQGFLALQLLIGRFFEHRHVGDLNNLTESDYVLEWTELDRYRFVPFPSAPHPSNPGLESLFDLYDLLYWAFAFVVAVQAGEIVRERERRHFMRISGGLQDRVYHTALFVSILVTCAVASILMTITLITSVFHNSQFFATFLLLFLIGLASVEFALAGSAFFSSERLAALIVFLIYGCTAFIIEVEIKPGLCILPGAAAHVAMRLMVHLEITQRGVTFHTYDEEVWGVSPAGLVLISLLSALLWWCVFYYAEQVIPYAGIAAPTRAWYFPLSPAYWRGIFTRTSRESQSLLTFREEGGLVLNSVTRQYSKGVVGIRSVAMKAPQGRCTVLLGRNGAGKSTLISLVVGTQNPTEGSILSPPASRIGFCPQRSVLWSELTIAEHVDLWCGLRGRSSHDDCLALARELNLDEQWEVQAGNLSGGQRRCLSVMLAFAGGPELVVLDEPSTGLDESARRKLSQAILRARTPSRAILVSTHYMDEAEYIADEVALLDDGQLIAKGSVPELTSSLDSSLVLRAIFRPDADPSQCITLLARKLAANGIHSQTCATAGRSASIGLRRGSSIKDQDKALRIVEDSLDELQIDTFSVSTVNLGHFFDWVTEALGNSPGFGDERTFEACKKGSQLEDTDDCSQLEADHHLPGLRRQLSALLVRRRLTLYTREWIGTLALLAIPALVMVCLFGLIELGERIISCPPYSVSDLTGVASAIEEPLVIPVATADVASTLPTATEGKFHFDIVNSSTSQDFSDYLLSSRHSRSTNNVGAFFRQRSTYQIWHNTTYHHSAPAFTSIEVNRRLESMRAPRITFVNHPLPIANFDGLQLVKGTILVVAIGIAMSLIPGPVISFVVMERYSGVTDQLLVAGVRPLSYWSSNLAADFLWVGLGGTAVVQLMLLAFNSEPFTISLDWTIVTFMLLASFSLSVLPATYLLSFLFLDRTRALVGTIVSGIVLTTIVATGVFAVGNLGSEDCESCFDIASSVAWCLHALPHFSLGNGLLKAVFWGTTYKISPWSSHILNNCESVNRGRKEACIAGPLDNVPLLVILAPVFFVLVLLSDYIRGKVRGRQSGAFLDHEDDGSSTALVRMQNVSKNFGGKEVVNEVSLDVEAGEVVGFLGTNGAGKTTLFKLICGLDTPSSGAISICGNNGGTSKARMHVGYCSQQDALWDSLSAREHLIIYSRLRGHNDGRCMMVVDRLIAYIGLSGEVADRPSGELSGGDRPAIAFAVLPGIAGNRRKLSMAIALVGSPSVILVDEPTARMDPISQRPIWELIGKMAATKDRAVVSHPMRSTVE
ncbi:hypothetical protein FOZ61_010578 [Perkinsus olseni]|uniref:ABC transporter domain-containing protein n=1 Tax=Perkinsus olseni TaxID=32597 RepID=A0A7J6KVR8_PEROL|nr:hypothetical protein FOZ61_010578 [Perkinsus olseni]